MNYDEDGVSREDLKMGEPHPAAYDAIKWINENYTNKELYILIESFSSCALSKYGDGGNTTLHDVCIGTLKRVVNGEKFSDRYILGLAWILRNMKEEKRNTKRKTKSE